MGMRQNIKLVYSNSIDVGKPTEKNVIYLYSHWGGDFTYKESTIADKLATAIARKQRWDDESYLARIIVSEVLKDDIEDETGYGLSPDDRGGEFPDIVVNLHDKTIDGMSFDEFLAECNYKV